MPEQPPQAQQQMSPEQVAALQEKIKNMSPEELKEFQKKQCIFCQIISGKVQSKKIFEDEKVIAILDINPANPGHLLVLPKEHYTIMPQVPKDELAHLFIIIKYLSNAVLKSLGVQGTNILVANGVAAGQKAQHFMAHLIPRKANDDVKFDLPQKQLSEQEVDIIRDKLAKKIAELLETKPAEKKAAKPKASQEKKVVDAEVEDMLAGEEKPEEDTNDGEVEEEIKKESDDTQEDTDHEEDKAEPEEEPVKESVKKKKASKKSRKKKQKEIDEDKEDTSENDDADNEEKSDDEENNEGEAGSENIDLDKIADFLNIK